KDESVLLSHVGENLVPPALPPRKGLVMPGLNAHCVQVFYELHDRLQVGPAVTNKHSSHIIVPSYRCPEFSVIPEGSWRVSEERGLSPRSISIAPSSIDVDRG